MKTLEHLSIQSNSVNTLIEELREFENIKTCHFYMKRGIFDSDKMQQIRKETGIQHKY